MLIFFFHTGTASAKNKGEERRQRAFKRQKEDVHIRNTGQKEKESGSTGRAREEPTEEPKSHGGRNWSLSLQGQFDPGHHRLLIHDVKLINSIFWSIVLMLWE
jgi:hypothetical protein